jgi:hypothetical protein
LERDHGPWVRRSRWRPQAWASWVDWTHRRQVWLVRTEKCTRQSTPRVERMPVAVEDPYDLTKLPWQRWDGMSLLIVVRGHWGIENNGFRTRDMAWQEARAWCTKGAATDGLGLLRRWAYNLVGLLKGRYLRARRYRAHTLAGFVAWIARVSVWEQAQRCVRWVVLVPSEQAPVGRGTADVPPIRPPEPPSAEVVCPRIAADRPEKGLPSGPVLPCSSLGRSK